MSSDGDFVKDAEILSDNEQTNIENDFIDNMASENIEAENTEEVQREETSDGEKQAEDVKHVKVKRVIRNPQPKLNAETIKGPRGIAAISSYFERVKFKGNGFEPQDLNVIMKTYEYWCHRLFPKFPFNTCIERLEKLGTKKAVQTHIKRIRLDLLIENEDKPIIDSSDEEANVEGFVDVNNAQINEQFDNIFQDNQPELTEDQLERIRLNKERAEKLRQERLSKIKEKAEANLEVSSQLPTTSGINDNIDMESTQETDNQEEILWENLQEPIFDLESNIKGKMSVKGIAIKKGSSKKENHFDDDKSTNIHQNEQNGNGRHLIDSDDDGSSENIIKRNANILDSDESDKEDMSDKIKRKVANILSSDDDSDQEMVTCENSKLKANVRDNNSSCEIQKKVGNDSEVDGSDQETVMCEIPLENEDNHLIEKSDKINLKYKENSSMDNNIS